jgi:hypothetical protein
MNYLDRTKKICGKVKKIIKMLFVRFILDHLVMNEKIELKKIKQLKLPIGVKYV